MSRVRVLFFLLAGWSGAVCAQSGTTQSLSNKQFEFRARSFCANEWQAARSAWRNPSAPSLRDGLGHSGSFGDTALKFGIEELQQQVSYRQTSGYYRDPINTYLTCLLRYRVRELTADVRETYAVPARPASTTRAATTAATREPAVPPKVHPVLDTAPTISTAPQSPTVPPGGTDAVAVVGSTGVVSICDGVTEVKRTLSPQYRVSAPTPFAASCDGVPATGTLFANSEVEPYVAINPLDPNNLIGAWQQDRWSDGGSRGIVTGVSQDGGITWTLHPMPFSRCGGGVGISGDYARATDPWVTFSPDGTAHQLALAFTGGTFQAGSSNAMLASRSINGGTAWSTPVRLILGDASTFNDKNSITADPTDSRYVYAVWDRIGVAGGGPTFFARTGNGGVSWGQAHSIYDPGLSSQTIGNLIAVRPDGLLLDLFTQIDEAADHSTSAFLAVIRSSDKGLTWSAPSRIADLLAIGVSDPETGALVRDGSVIPQMAIAPDGTIYVVWQDARFSGGVRDGIALSHSSDGGLTWSAPVRINARLSVQAFTPAIHIRADGTIAVTYYDLTSNTSDPATLLTDYWVAQSNDGAIWRWNRISPAFNLAVAPNAGGLFIGDYQGLINDGSLFVPLFVRSNAGDLTNRTDVFAAPAVVPSAAPPLADVSESIRIATAPPQPISAALRLRVHQNLVRNVEGLPGWRNGVRRRPGAPPPRIERD